ncbi:MAG: hypothetical protein HYZ22_15495 [Chloroflexi bacterium]|nr:hypothetical protein [Chloroflexota bacterium]
MKRFPYLALLALILTAIACGTQTATATTEAPAATDAPVDPPTATLVPTIAPTATLDTAATVAAQSTQAAGAVLTELEELLADSEVAYQDGHVIWQQTEPIEINMTGPSSDDTSVGIDEKLTAANFIFKSDVTWEATGWMYCGAILRSEPDIDTGKQYQFYFLRLSGLPVWYIDLFENNSFINTISKEQQSSEIDMANGAVNQFVLVAQDEMFIVYFNGVRQGRFFDNSKQRLDGNFGFFAWQESGTGSCKFENSWIWSLDK